MVGGQWMLRRFDPLQPGGLAALSKNSGHGRAAVEPLECSNIWRSLIELCWRPAAELAVAFSEGQPTASPNGKAVPYAQRQLASVSGHRYSWSVQSRIRSFEADFPPVRKPWRIGTEANGDRDILLREVVSRKLSVPKAERIFLAGTPGLRGRAPPSTESSSSRGSTAGY